ncbi:hypothetical protein [Paractinoplanes deccanensis]|uniref:hypothetical protein n=1 Tax=Paractinoplanes deccanensis TaxID=113561 RepID=UPI0019423F37|nr:hypothetical protein [Actinoplanes deccanensis]
MLGNILGALALTVPVTGAPVTLKAPAEPAPTNVTVAWASPAHKEIVITWDETGDFRNQVALVNTAEPNSFVSRQIVAAGQPDRLVVKNDWNLLTSLNNFDAVFTVTAVDASGTAISEAGKSPVFDTATPPRPVLTSVLPGEDGTVKMTWTPGTAKPDTTPNDPLDAPADGPQQFVPYYIAGSADQPVPAGEPTTGTSFVVKAGIPTLFTVGVYAPNEWTDPVQPWSTSGAQVFLFDTRITATIPKSVPAGGKLTVTGKAIRKYQNCSRYICNTVQDEFAGRLLHLEARTGATGAWKTVATTNADKAGTFTFTVANPATADYRVVAPVAEGTSNGDKAALTYFATAPATVTAGSATGGGNTPGGDQPGTDQPGGEPGTDQPGGEPGTGGTGGGDSLPITGAPIVWISVAGGLLLLVGAAFFLTGRLRRRRTTFTA